VKGVQIILESVEKNGGAGTRTKVGPGYLKEEVLTVCYPLIIEGIHCS
jgi:hypothetical protein